MNVAYKLRSEQKFSVHCVLRTAKERDKAGLANQENKSLNVSLQHKEVQNTNAQADYIAVH